MRTRFAALLLAGLAAGCATSGGEPGVGPDLRAAHSDAVVDDLVLPVDDYGYTAVEVGQVILARELLVHDCRRRSGSPGVREPDRAALERDTRNRVADFGSHGGKRRYGVVEVDIAATYGYHLPSSVDGSGAESNSAEKKPEPPAACLAEADKAIAGSDSLGDDELVKKISWESYDRSLSSPTLVEALDRWSSCMKARGYDYAAPADAESVFAARPGAVGPVEIATAVADVSCKGETRLVDTWRGIEESHQRAEVEEHRDELEAARKAHDRRVERVTGVIAAH